MTTTTTTKMIDMAFHGAHGEPTKFFAKCPDFVLGAMSEKHWRPFERWLEKHEYDKDGSVFLGGDTLGESVGDAEGPVTWLIWHRKTSSVLAFVDFLNDGLRIRALCAGPEQLRVALEWARPFVLIAQGSQFEALSRWLKEIEEQLQRLVEKK